MNLNTNERVLQTDPVAGDLVAFLRANEAELSLSDSEIYFDFIIMKDWDDVVVIAKLLIISPRHGMIVIATSNASTSAGFYSELKKHDEELVNLYSLTLSKLIKNKVLRQTKSELSFPFHIIIYAPYSGAVDDPASNHLMEELDTIVIRSAKQMGEWLNESVVEDIPNQVFSELVATLEGAKALQKPKSRDIPADKANSKGRLANLVEAEIVKFDHRQKEGYMITLDGLQRIRGLAGSGKTVVLAMKAAQIHLRNPEASILYTFHTKSLYQQIKRLITRFYRQYEDKDPDWNKIKILHSWGGVTNEGVIYNTCVQSGIPPITYPEAVKANRYSPFEFVCDYVLKKAVNIFPKYDYIFIDEGQDFPVSFIRICLKLVEHNRAVFAYDELQNIFQTSTPTIGEIVGVDENGKPLVELTQDTVLYKCYRNPREIIVCAHALGFGLYSSQIVQMLENQEQWVDVGYNVLEGDFTEGSHTVIERPIENSLISISENQKPNEIVLAKTYDSVDEEIDSTIESIVLDLADGLRPDDILIICVDDRNASNYFQRIVEGLHEKEIYCNNLHTDTYGIRDFQKDDLVTLSTVHKAKGNESYMVYVLGVDALFNSPKRVRARNSLFTAMTRAKGWVRVSGVGTGAQKCEIEINHALENFPNLIFEYPSVEQLKVIKRDLKEKDSKKLRAEKQLDEVLSELTPDEIRALITEKFPSN